MPSLLLCYLLCGEFCISQFIIESEMMEIGSFVSALLFLKVMDLYETANGLADTCRIKDNLAYLDRSIIATIKGPC